MDSVKKFSKRVSIYKIAFAAIFLFLFSPLVFAQNLPQNGTVVEGNATLDYTQPDTLNVNVGSDKVITNWDSFNVASGNTVNFNRDSSFISLNRVTGADPSSIFGNINAQNGQIFLVNPNGVIFGSGSHVNAAGLVASTLDITNENFMKGNYEFFKVAGKNGYIVNKGLITTSKPGGYICLFSQAIDNQGFAVANLGTVVLAAGEEITMSLDDKGTISVVISKEVQSAIVDANGNRFDSAIKNSGTLQANGGKIILTAEVLNGVFDYAINNSGVIQAAALDEHDGVIELKASGAPIINTATGTIEASKSITIDSNSDIINDGGIEIKDATATVTGPVIIIDAGGGTITNTGSIMANGTAISVNGGKIALIAATVLQNGIVIANAFDGGTAGRVEISAVNSITFGHDSTTTATCPFNIGNGGQIVVSSTNGSVSVLDGAVIDVSAGTNQGNAGSVEIDAFDQLGFYGVLNGRAPPGYSAAKVTLRTTRPYDSALLSLYSLYLNGSISARDITIFTNQRLSISGNYSADDFIQIDSQGIDITGTFDTPQLLVDAHNGDSSIGPVTQSGDYEHLDTGTITVIGNITSTNGKIKIIADSDDTAGGDYIQNTGVTVKAKEKVTIRSGSDKDKGSGNVTVGTVTSTTGNVEITAAGGYIQRNSDTVGISANTLTLAAKTIGQLATPLITNVDTLKDPIASVGGIYINELNGLTIDKLSSNGGEIIINVLSGNLLTKQSITTNGGNLTLTAAGNLTVGNGGTDDIATGAGSITLKADSNEDGIGNLSIHDGVTLSSSSSHILQGANSFDLNTAFLNKLIGGATALNVKSTAGNITVTDAVSKSAGIDLRAAGNIAVNNNLTASAGNIILYADNDNSGLGNFSQASGKSINASGDVNIKSSGDTTVRNVTAGHDINVDINSNLIVGLLTAGNNINLNANSGSISANPGSLLSALSLTLNALNGIGTSVSPINTNVSTLSASSTNGSIYINESNDVAINVVSAVNGDVSINANGDISGLDIGSANIIAKHLSLTANGSIGGAYYFNNVLLGKDGNYLRTSVDSIDVSAGSDIYIYNEKGVSYDDVTSTTGIINLVSNGDTVADYISTPNDVIITVLNGNLCGVYPYPNGKNIQADRLFLDVAKKIYGPNLYGNLVTSANELTAYAGHGYNGSIHIGNIKNIKINEALVYSSEGIGINIAADGDISVVHISDPSLVYLWSTNKSIIALANGSNPNIEAVSLILNARTGIGSGNALKTDVDTLTASNSTSGDISIVNSGDLNAISVINNASNGNVNLTVNSNLTVGTISAVNTVNLTANSGSIIDDSDQTTRITANNIILNAFGSIGGFGSGTLNEMLAPMLDVVLGTGNLTANAGGNIYISEHGTANLLTLKYSLTSTGVGKEIGLLNYTSNGDLTVNSAVSGGDDSIWLAAAKDIYVNNPFTTTGNYVGLHAFGNVNIASDLSSGSNIEIEADADGIGGGSINQTAGTVGSGTESLDLYAAEGINLIATKVARLAAENTTSGNIQIANAGPLELVNLSSGTYSVKNLGGAINISTTSPLTVSDDVLASGDITLSAKESATWAVDTLRINADIISNNGNILLSAGDDILQGNGTTIQTLGDGKTITLRAGFNDSDSYGNIYQYGNAQILTNNGNVNLTAWGDILLGYINAGSGTVTLISEHTRVLDNNGDAVNVVADNLIISSVLGIGSHPSWGENALETAVANILANNTSGNININNNSATPVDATTNTTNGDINFNQTGHSSLTFNGSTTNGNIFVNVANGDLIVGAISATGTNTLVNLMASGAILDGNDSTGPPTPVNNITATNLVLSAANGIGSGNPLETQVTNLTATNSTSGNIEIDNTGDLNILGVANDALNDDVIIRVHSNLIIGATGYVTTNGGDITLQADGNVYVHGISTNGTFTGSSIPLSGIVTIIAGGNIEDGYDSAYGNPDNVYDISAKDIILTGTNIGTTPLSPIEIRSDSLTINSNGIVNLFHKGDLSLGDFNGVSFRLINAGDLTVNGDIITNGGDVYLEVIEDPDLIINALIDSGGGDVTLSAARHIVINFLGSIMTRGGNFTAMADTDNNYIGTYIMNPGSSVDTASGAASAGDVFISGDDAEIYGTVYAGDADITITPNLNQTIGLGGGFGAFLLSDDELDRLMTTGLLTVGSVNAGNISVDQITQGSKTLQLITGGNLTEWGTDGWGAGADISVNHLILNVAGDVGELGNSIETDLTLLEGHAGGLININEFDNLALNTLDASDVILTLREPNSSLTDNNGAAPNIIADTAILDVTQSIDLDTEVGTLSARIRDANATGDIHIDNTGALVLDDLAGWTYSVKNFGSGDIDISTASPITVNADVIANGDITLTTTDLGDGDIIINDNITSNLGNVTLNAARNIETHLSSIVHGKYVDVNAVYLAMYNSSIIEGTDTVDIDTSGDVELFDDSIIQAHNLVKIVSDNDLLMHDSSAIQTDLGSVYIKTARNVEMYDSSYIWTLVDVTIDAEGEVRVSNSSIHAGRDVDIDAVNNIYLGVISADNSINLRTTAGDIIDTNDTIVPVTNLTTPNLYMYAFGNIGVGGDRIDTDVDDIREAIAYHGNVLINELDGVKLWNIQALGSTVDIITGGDTYAYHILAEGSGLADPATINLLVTSGNLFITKDTTIVLPYDIYAHQLGSGDASVNLTASTGNINISGDSTVKALVDGDGTATVDIDATTGAIDIQDSTVKALVTGLTAGNAANIYLTAGTSITLLNDTILANIAGDGNALIEMDANGGDLSMTDSEVEASVDGSGTSNSAKVDLDATGNIILTKLLNLGTIKALLTGGNSAQVLMTAGLGVDINNGTVLAQITEDGTALIDMDANGGDITITDGTITAEVDGSGTNTATVNITARDNVTIDPTNILAQVVNGTATVDIDATTGAIDIQDSTVKALVTGLTAGNAANIYLTAGTSITLLNDTILANIAGDGNALIEMDANGGDLSMTDSEVEASVDGSGTSNSAKVDLDATGNIILTKLLNLGTIKALLTGGNSAQVLMTAGLGVDINNGTVLAQITEDGTALIDMDANGGDITITDGTITAEVDGSGTNTATVNITARDNVTIDPTNILAQVVNGTATVDIDATTGAIDIQDSTVKALVTGLTAGNAANIYLTAGTSITLLNDTILANIAGDGNALIEMDANGGDLSMTDSEVEASVDGSGTSNSAKVDLDATGNIILTKLLNLGTIKALLTGGNSAQVLMTAGLGVDINNGTVLAQITEDGTALIDMDANGGDITITDGTITAEVDGSGTNTATVNITARDNVTIDPTNILAQVVNGTATVDIDATTGAIDIQDSTVKALVTGLTAGNAANIYLTAGTSITLLNDTILANIAGDGNALIEMDANGGDLSMTDSEVEASVDGSGTSNSAKVDLDATGNIILTKLLNLGTIKALLTGGNSAQVLMTAGLGVDINNGTVLAQITEDGTALIDMDANGGDITITDGTITAEVDGSGTNTATVNITARDNVTIDPTNILAQVVNGTATVDIDATTGAIDIQDSTVKALVTGLTAGNAANIYLTAGTSITLLNDTILANIAGDGNALIEMDANGGDLSMTDSEVEASVDGSGTSNSAKVDLDATGNIILTKLLNLGTIKALLTGGNSAQVLMTAGLGVDINNGTVLAQITEDGTALIDMDANGGDITITDGTITAEVDGSGTNTATVNITARDNVTIDPTNILAQVVNGTATVDIDATTGAIDIQDSTVKALVTGLTAGNAANIYLTAGTSITLLNDTILANIAGDGNALIEMDANGGDLSMTDSEVEASVDGSGTSNSAKVDLDATGNIILTKLLNLGTIKALLTGGNSAQVLMTAGLGVDINNGTVLAQITEDGTALIDMDANGGDITITDGTITAEVDGSGTNTATVNITARDNVTIDPTNILAQVVNGTATVDIDATTGAIDIQDSTVKALVTGLTAGNAANIYLTAGTSITLLNDTILANIAGDGNALIEMDANGGDLSMTDSEVEASVDGSGTSNSAKVDLDATGNIILTKLLNLGTIKALLTGGNSAQVLMTAGLGVDINNGTVLAQITEDGTALIDMDANGGDITITDGTITAEVDGSGTNTATVNITARDNVTIDPTNILAQVVNGTATVDIDATTGAIDIQDSTVKALVTGLTAGNAANIYLTAGTSITLLNDTILANIAGDGNALIEMDANGGDLSMTDSEVEASVDGSGTSNSAKVDLDATGNIILTKLLNLGTIKALLTGGNSAQVLMTAGLGVDINNGTVLAQITEDGTALIDMDANGGDITITDGTITAEVDGSGTNTATVNITARDNVTIDPTNILAQVVNGTATVDIDATTGAIDIQDSTVKALVTGLTAGNAANIYLTAGTSITLLNDTILANIAGDGNALIEMDANGGDLSMTDSEVEASVDGSGTSNSAKVDLDATGNIILTKLLNLGTIKALLTGGNSAQVLMTAGLGVDINNGTVLAQITEDGTALIDMDANGGDITITDGTITAEVDGTATGNNADINLDASGSIYIDPTVILASVVNGDASIDLTAGTFITIINSTIRALVTLTTDTDAAASVTFNAGTDIDLTDSEVEAEVQYDTDEIELDGNDISAEVEFNAGENIHLHDSDVEADIELTTDSDYIELYDSTITATVIMDAEGNIEITDDSLVESSITLNSESYIWLEDYSEIESYVNLHADGSVTLTNSDVNAIVDLSAYGEIWLDESDVESDIELTSYDDSIYLDNSDITSSIIMDAEGEIAIEDESLVESSITLSASDTIEPNSSTIAATVNLHSDNDMTINDSDVEADVELDANNIDLYDSDVRSTIDLTSWDGSIYLDNADILADVVFDAEETIDIDDSEIEAEINLSASETIEPNFSTIASTVNLHSDYDMTIDESDVEANVELDADYIDLYDSDVRSTIDLTSWDGSIYLDNANILADVVFDAENTIDLDDSEIEAEINISASETIEPNFSTIASTVNLHSDYDMTIDESDVEADVELDADYIDLYDSDVRSTIDLTSWDGSIYLDNANILADVVFDAEETIDIDDSTIEATVNGDGDASIYMNADDGDIDITDSTVTAQVTGDGDADINLHAYDTINIDPSTIEATVGGDGDATIEMDTDDGDINITDGSTVNAEVTGDGNASIDIDADGDISIMDSDITATVNGTGLGNTADITLTAGNGITVDPSNIIASVINGNATINLTANGLIDINDNSEIKSITTNGDATVTMTAQGITIRNNSLVTSNVLGTGAAKVELTATAGDVGIADSIIEAISVNGPTADIIISASGVVLITNASTTAGKHILSQVTNSGDASISITASAGTVTITNGDIDATVGATGDATITIDGNAGITIDPTTITAQTVTGDASITLTSTNGPITITNSTISSNVLGNGNALTKVETHGLNYDINLINSVITASVVGTGISEANLLSWNGSIYGDANSRINADYAGLLAQSHIGTLLSPINTNVDYLSAYSWGTGNIYIKELNEITLGYILDSIGASVAANNGIIHIVSAGNMFVNSVISPRGGVYLESTNGSIYAGQGWSPVANAPVILPIGHNGTRFFDSLILASMMDLAGTPWAVMGTDFSPIMTPLTTGPNVIAGGYSYFSTPNGTIGVGTPGAPSVTNPLKVNIQVIPGSKSAAPTGFSPVAGLTLLIGGGAGSYDAGNGSGTLPISGVIQGIVRPGVTAETGVYPAPALDKTSTSPLSPPGYVLYDDTDSATVMGVGTMPFTSPAAANAGLLQIWPAYLPKVPTGILEELLKRGLGYYEILSLIRITNDTATPFFFGYHPLTPMDYSAFDGINLDIGAYDFIEGNLNLKDKNKLYPYYQQNEDLKKINPPAIL